MGSPEGMWLHPTRLKVGGARGPGSCKVGGGGLGFTKEKQKKLEAAIMAWAISGTFLKKRKPAGWEQPCGDLKGAGTNV